MHAAMHAAMLVAMLVAMPGAMTGWVRRCSVARSTRRALTELDDRLLADAGLSRGEALHEAERPFWDHRPVPADPSRRGRGT